MKKLSLVLVLITIHAVAFCQDLVISAVDGVKSIKRYVPWSLSVTFKNAGAANISKSTSTSVYLSADNKYSSATDRYIGDISVGAINAGESKTVAFTSDLSAALATGTGTYYLIANADRTNAVAETNETNNQFIEGGYIVGAPDLDFYFTSFRVDQTAASPNGEITPAYTTADKGTTPVYGQTPFTYYLSHDQILDGGDMIVKTTYNYPSNGNRMKSGIDERLVVPPNIAPGVYYLIAKVNANDKGVGTFQESDVTNNVAVSEQLTISASNVDLDFTGLKGKAVLNPNPTIFDLLLTFPLHNGGTTDVTGYKYSVYISKDGVLDASDYDMTQNASYATSAVPGGQTVQQGIEIKASASDPKLISSNLYVIVKVNGDGQILETNRDNNTLVIDGAGGYWGGQTYAYNLVTDVMMMEGAYNTIKDVDERIDLRVEYQNHTSQDIQRNETITVFITGTGSNSDFFRVGILNLMLNLPAGQTITDMPTIYMSDPLPAGTYIIDASSQMYPDFAFKTVVNVVSTRYILSGSIQGEDGVPVTKGELFVYKKGTDGLASVVQQLSTSTGAGFNVAVAPSAYTLYFVPDAAAFGEYVPTVMTKSLTLDKASFMNLVEDEAITFTILKVHPGDEGSKFIQGNITDGASSSVGRSRDSDVHPMTVQHVMVVLLSETDDILAYTRTDDAGNYKFENLPDGKYKVLPVFPFDQLQPSAPTLVDLTQLNAQVDFVVDADGVKAHITEILLQQVLSFAALPTKKYKEAPFEPGATSNATLPITYSSSNPDIVEIVNNMVVIKGVGKVTITARQAGNEKYQPAITEQELTIDKADQILLFEPLPGKVYNDAPFALNALADSDLVVQYTSSDPKVAKIVGDMVVITGAGNAVITGQQPGNDLYEAAASKEQILVVAKASQVISFDALPVHLTTDAITLPPNSSAGLPISYASNNPEVASIEGNLVTILGSGDASITATQEGDTNYEVAQPVTRTLQVQIVLGTEDVLATLAVLPNPTKGTLKFSNTLLIRNVSITDMTGGLQPLSLQDDELDIRSFEPGVYLLTIQTTHSVKVIKIVKE